MIQPKLLAAAAAISLALASAPPALAQAPSSDAPAFLTKANVANTFEIQSSQLAEQKSKNPAILRFAREMIKDHSKAAHQMDQAEKRAHMPASQPSLDPPHEDMLHQLQAANGQQFDSLYVQMQKQGHEQAVGLFTTYAQSGDNPAIVGFAKKALPVLRRHLQHIDQIAGQHG